MEPVKILVTDDEKEIADLLEIYLVSDGYEVFKAYNGKDAIKIMQEQDISLAILDIMMPGMDGVEVCKEIRKTSHIPIIFLSAKSTELDKILGLGSGADDYVTKPFNPLELTARVKSQLRRFMEFGNYGTEPGKDNSERIHLRGLDIDRETHVVTVDGEEVRLTPLEFDILWLLASNPGKVFSTDDIFRKVWNETVYEANNTVMVHIRRLRTKIRDDQRSEKIITTVWGVGYKIEQ
ncbi:MAG: response regulator transcription factor [Parasporobacterium sp.]|nr:response regulator transcription factor [Parasporobacterium sp.]